MRTNVWTSGLGRLACLGVALWLLGCKSQEGKVAESGHEGHGHESAPEAKKGEGEAGEAHEGEEAEGHEGHGHEGEEQEGKAQGGHEGHAHGGGAEGENPPLEELSKKQCEHSIPQLECNECRYELGVARVPKAQQAELLTFEEVKQGTAQSPVLEMRCEAGRSAVASSTVTALVSGRVQRVHLAMGQAVKAGDVLFTILSDDFARIRLEHQTVHQKLELATARKEQFEKTQASLKVLLEKLAAGPDVAVSVADLSGMPLGKSKAELLEASSQHSRALAEWKRFERLENDATALIRRLRGGSGSIDGLKVGDAKGKLLQARADLSLAEKTYRRAKELSAQGVVAKNDYEVAARDLESAQAGFKAALEQVELDMEAMGLVATESLESARARLQGAMEQAILDADLQLLELSQEMERSTSEVQVMHRQLTLLGLSEDEIDELLEGQAASKDALEIKSPVDGVVVVVSATVGQAVDRGVALAELADTSRVWVWCDVFEKDLALLAQAKLPLPALIRSDAFPGQSFPGQLDYLAPDSDATSRTVKARVTAGSGGGLLRPGMYVRTTVQTAGPDAGIWLPEGAVVEDGTSHFVFVRWGEENFVRRFVEVGPAAGKRVPVFSGVAAGDWVVVRGAFYLKSDVLREKMGAGCAD